jgi:hypothetical protein
MSTLTDILGIAVPENADTGIVTILATAFQAFENALCRTTSVPVVVAAVSISADQFRSAAILFTGVKTVNAVVQFPAKPRLMLVANDSTGAFTLSVKSGASGTPVVIAATDRKWLWIKDTAGNIELL